MALTEKEKLKLRNKARAELDRLEQLENDKDTIYRIEAFKRKFLKCEIVYKIFLKKKQEDAKKRKKKQKGKKKKQEGALKLNFNQVKPTLKYVGLPFDKELMKFLFSTDEKGGLGTVKSLRNALTHTMSKSAVDELLTREAEMHACMDSFLNLVRNFDSKSEAIQ